MRSMSAKSVLFLTAALLISSAPADALSFDTYRTAMGDELITTLPGDGVNRVLYSIDLGISAANGGKILVVNGECEMENDGTATALLTAQVILAGTPSATTGTALSQETTQGISVAMYRNKRFKGAIYTVPTGVSGRYINFYVRSDHDLTVRVNRGDLEVLKISP